MLFLYIVELVNKNGLKITLEVNKNDTVYHIKAYFSNQSTAPMEGLMLKLAAPKVKTEKKKKGNRLLRYNETF
jgi:hypothetical protein